MRFASRSPEETARLGRAVAEAVEPRSGLFVSLCGPLGAGKTVLVKGMAQGLGMDPDLVASPTFVLASRYEGQGAPDAPPLVHADLYRIESADALLAAGFLDWLEPGALVVAEWGDRFPDALPQDRLELRIEGPPAAPETERIVHATAHGPAAAAALARLEAALGAEAGAAGATAGR